MYGSLGGIPFKIDPESVSWSYQPKVREDDTLGGKVVQVYGSILTNVTLSGWFGSSGTLEDGVVYDTNWQAQQAFLDQVDAWAETQIGDLSPSNGVGVQNGSPIRLVWSNAQDLQYDDAQNGNALTFDLMVYIVSYTSPQSSRSIRLAPDLYSPTWTLSLFVYQDNAPLDIISSGNAVDQINRIAAMFGWFPNQFTGVVTSGQYPTQVNTQ